MLPPATDTRYRPASKARPSTKLSASATGKEPGSTNDSSAHRGVAAIAARSLKLTASALCPISAGVE
jgi:hypothetical protein